MKWIPYNKRYSCGGASSNPTTLNWSLLMFFVTLIWPELCTLDHHCLSPGKSWGFCSLEWQKEGFNHSAQACRLPRCGGSLCGLLLLLQPLFPPVLPLILSAILGQTLQRHFKWMYIIDWQMEDFVALFDLLIQPFEEMIHQHKNCLFCKECTSLLWREMS